MKIIRTQSLKDGVYSVTLKCGGYGRRNLTANEEREIIENYGCKIIFKDIDFSDYYKLDNGNVIKGSSDDGDLVKLNLNNQEIELNSELLLEYSVKVTSLSDSVVGTNLTTKEKVATAMCKLFADKIEETITDIIDKAIEKTDDFEGVTEITL